MELQPKPSRMARWFEQTAREPQPLVGYEQGFGSEIEGGPSLFRPVGAATDKFDSRNEGFRRRVGA